eukprot:jgi/Hompol1/3361/HPOL_006501-RA
MSDTVKTDSWSDLSFEEQREFFCKKQFGNNIIRNLTPVPSLTTKDRLVLRLVVTEDVLNPFSKMHGAVYAL